MRDEKGCKVRTLLFGHGFCAFALAQEISARGWELRGNVKPCSTMTFCEIRSLIEGSDADVVINGAAFIPPSGRVADCDSYKAETYLGNVVFPAIVSKLCLESEKPLIHISTGCLYDEAREYEETDAPLRGWNGYCGQYIGTKLMAETILMQNPNSYILRIRLPFDEISHPRNFLNKLMEFPTVYRHMNSLTHRGEFARAALDLFQLDAPYGIYHVANQGQISAEEVCEKLLRAGIMKGTPNFVDHPTTGCRLSTRKLSEVGVMMRNVEEAVDSAIKNWRK
jgi:dTDP-4-dehydrorhamnose reductase